MNLNILRQFRLGLYQTFGHEKDALFDLTDALLTETPARSLPEFSLSPYYQRGFASLYKSLQRGTLDRIELGHLLAHFAPVQHLQGWRPMLAVDPSSIARPFSPTARDRTALPLHNLPTSGEASAVTYGWQFSTVVLLPPVLEPSSAVYILDNTRIPSHQTVAEMAAEQLAQLTGLLPDELIVTADRHYGSCRFLKLTEGLRWDKLVRFKRNSVFYRPVVAGTKPGRGAPRKDGPVFKCKDPTTQGNPDEVWEGLDPQGQPIKVERWGGLHFRQARDIPLGLLRVTRPHASDKKRDPKVSWFGWVAGAGRGSEAPIALREISAYYKQRYSIEHGYRFFKQEWLWEKPHLRTPEQFQLWSDLLSAVHDQLVLRRPLVEAVRHGWESAGRKPSLRQVRRGFSRIISELGRPSRPPQVRGKALGRVNGTKLKPALRYFATRWSISVQLSVKRAENGLDGPV